MKLLKLCNGTELRVLDNTTNVHTIHYMCETPETFINIMSLLTDSALKHVELFSGSEVISQMDDATLLSAYISTYGDNINEAVYSLLPLGNNVSDDIIDKANAYDILTGEAE